MENMSSMRRDARARGFAKRGKGVNDEKQNIHYSLTGKITATCFFHPDTHDTHARRWQKKGASRRLNKRGHW